MRHLRAAPVRDIFVNAYDALSREFMLDVIVVRPLLRRLAPQEKRAQSDRAQADDAHRDAKHHPRTHARATVARRLPRCNQGRQGIS